MKGIERFRQAIKNQRDAGEGEFRLTYHDAEEIATEIGDELTAPSWAKGVPAPVDADGEVVPLTTKVMYGDDGMEYEGSLYRSFIWSSERGRWYFGAIGCTRGVASLHLRRPDSWERLEEDVRNSENGSTCGYYGMEAKPCGEDCPAYKDLQIPCAAIALKNVLRRAKALAGRGED